MRKLVRTGRIAVLFVVFFVIISIYIAKMYQLQILDGGRNGDLINTTTSVETIPASRGDLLDRNGTLLVSNEVSYYITLNRSAILEQENPNEILLELVRTASEYGVDYTDTFPVTKGAPFEYLANQTDNQSYCLKKYFDYFDLDPNISASDLIVWLKDHYGIDYAVPIAQARVMIGVRYEMEIRVIVGLDEYIFADDVTTDFISILEERRLPGVNVEISTSRVYHTKYAAHLLGYVGKMNAEEYEKYKELDYPMNAEVGKSGVEQAFEEYLHGTDGLRRVTRYAENGAVIGVETIRPEDPGENVYLSIDIGVQQTAEESLKDKIIALNEDRESGDMVTGGAVVVESVKDGQVIALASYPTFDISKFFENYTELINDVTNPLFNRATMGTYNPGSTFKMVTGYAGLRAGFIGRDTTINDTGVYRKYADFQPRCWLYSVAGGGHGPLNIVDALRYSCNYFFYSVGDNIGADAIVNAAESFGFGASTGIETGDAAGTVASPDYKKEVLGEAWYAADTLLASIGQSHNYFTPAQIANYVSTIASGGTVNKLTLLNSVKSADYTETVFNNQPEKLREFDELGKNYISVLREGMEAVSTVGGSSYSIFGNYPVKVACKTGTVQSDSEGSNNGVFVCYAPADDPEIAVSIVIEKGKSGAQIQTIAKDILDYYFGDRTQYVTVAGENSLVQ